MQADTRRVKGLVLAALLSTAVVAFAGERDHDEARALRDRGEIVPLEQILQAAAAQRPGRVVEVEFELEFDLVQGGKTYVYEVELLDAGGEVWELKYDARTGVLLQEERER